MFIKGTPDIEVHHSINKYNYREFQTKITDSESELWPSLGVKESESEHVIFHRF